MHVEYQNDYNEIVGNLIEKKEGLTNVFGEETEIGFTVNSQFRDSMVKTKIDRSAKISNGLCIYSNFHRELPGGVMQFNEIDLKTEYNESEKYFFDVLVPGFGAIKDKD